jgi:hypothetical protein
MIVLARPLPPVIPEWGSDLLRLAAAPVAYPVPLGPPNVRPPCGRGAVAVARFRPLAQRPTLGSPYDQHYFFQDEWAANHVADQSPAMHVDVGSWVRYVGRLTAICDAEFVEHVFAQG